jgi:hypothetical protein
MSKASQIVSALLETDEPADVNIDQDDVRPEAFIAHHADELEREKREGKLTPNTALTAHYFYHRTLTYKDGRTPIQVRRNGQTKTWKTRPGEFRIPVKYGFKECFYITQKDADDWSTQPLPQKPKPEKVKVKPKPVVNPSDLMPPV